MERTQVIRQRREQVVSEMLSISSARKGSINQQFFPVIRNGKASDDLRGPYLVLTTKKRGKTVSIRLTTPDAIARARHDIANHQRLLALFREFQELTEQLGEQERQEDESKEALKKTPKLPSKRTRK